MLRLNAADCNETLVSLLDGRGREARQTPFDCLDVAGLRAAIANIWTSSGRARGYVNHRERKVRPKRLRQRCP